MKITEAQGAASFTGARARVTIITPGQGSSGYYPPETIAEAAGLFPAGTHMYLDHTTETERAERGVRSLSSLVGVLESDAELTPDGALAANVKIMPAWREFIREAAPYIGVSISASGEIEEADGRRTITRLTAVESVDFVTKPGRGGKIDSLLESATPPTNENPKEEKMSVTLTEAEHKKLTEDAARVAELEAQIKALQEELEAEKAKATKAAEAATRAEATAIVEEAFTGIDAPKHKARLIESALTGEFNAETFRAEALEEAAPYQAAPRMELGGSPEPLRENATTPEDILKEFGGNL